MNQASSAARPSARVWRNLLAAASVLVRVPLLKLLGREPDCWRRTVGLGLRSEGTRFALSSFGLRVPRDPDGPPTNGFVSGDAVGRFIRHFGVFLSREADAHFSLVHHRFHVERVPNSAVDLVQAEYNPAGELCALAAHLDPQAPSSVDNAGRRTVEPLLLLAHGATRHLSETVRPHELAREFRRRFTSQIGGRVPERLQAYGRRLLAAAVVSSEPMPAEPPARFLPPDFRRHRGLGASCFDVIVRLLPDGESTDLWSNIHHTAADGAPMQELLSRLERAWGVSEGVRLPAEDHRLPSFIQHCQTSPHDRPISLLVDFVDFSSLVDCRASLNARLAPKLGGPVPLPAVLLWCLAKQPEFAGRKFATAVDVPANQHWLRAVDLVAIRPADYFAQGGGFEAFARDYRSLVNAGRARTSSSYAAMRALSFVAPRLAAEALASDPDRARATFGTVGLSILKDAKVFVAPMADAGWDDGFLAIGNLTLPAVRGRTVGVLTVKGEPETIRSYPTVLRRALNDLSGLIGAIA